MEAKRGGEEGDQPQSRAARQDKMDKIVDPKQIAQAPLIGWNAVCCAAASAPPVMLSRRQARLARPLPIPCA